jgi:phage terminase small subunit
MALSAKRQAFCEEYVVDYNATAAAIRAGYSPKTADVQATELMKVECVKAEIDRLKAEKSSRTGVTRERIMEELAKMAFVNHQDVAGKDGQLKKGIQRADSAAIKKIRTRYLPDGSMEQEVELYDKTKALDILNKMVGAYEGKQNQIKLDGKEIRGLVILPDVEAETEPIEVVEDEPEEA